jgi:hypothetical protein
MALSRRPKSHLAGDTSQPDAAPSGAVDLSDSRFSAGRFDQPEAARTADAKSQLPDRLAALPSLSLGDLRLEWRRLYRAEPPRLSRDIMMRAIAYRLQEIAHGGLSRITQRRLTTLGHELETAGRIAPPPGPRIKPGARLIREWHGRTHTVCVTETGFEFEGKTYRSLTKIAFNITGAQWSGPRFFGLTKPPSAAMPDDASNSAETIPESANG